MTTKKKIILIVVIVVAVLLLPVIFVAAVWSLIFIGIWSEPNPPAPQETYGEFPFEITYTINDVQYTVNDVYICEYDGIGANEGIGKYRKWKGYIKGTGETSLVLYEDEERIIYCYVGDAEFYMNDEMYPEQRPLEPRVYSDLKLSAGEIYKKDRFDTTQEMMEYYKIEIIDWKLSEPIENSFE